MWHLHLTVKEFRKPKKKEKGLIYLDAFPELFSVSTSQSVKKAGSSFLSGHQVAQVVILQCSKGQMLNVGRGQRAAEARCPSAVSPTCFLLQSATQKLSLDCSRPVHEFGNSVLPRSHLTTDSSAPSRGFSQYWRCSHLVGRLAPSAATTESHTWHLTSCSRNHQLGFVKIWMLKKIYFW